MKKLLKGSFVLFLLSFIMAQTGLAAGDPYYYKQWYLDTIKAPQAWETTKGDSSVVVAVLDTGIDLNHPDIKGNIWKNTNEVVGDRVDNDNNGYIDDVNGWNFVDSYYSPNPTLTGGYNADAVNHGTFVAGIISAIHDNGQGIKGITNNVKIMPLLVLDATGYGNSTNVSEAVDYAVANGADIINFSFGGYEYSEKLRGSIVNAYNNGVLIVAAAGNVTDTGVVSGSDMTNNPIYPICYDQEFSVNRILGVLSSTKKHNVAAFSNYGEGCIDIAAPGEDVVSLLYQDNSYNDFKEYYSEGWNGTSFSVALVSGAAALLKSVDPSLTPKQIIEIITEESSVLFLQDLKYKNKAGKGLLNIRKAIERAIGGSSTSVVSTPPAVSTPAPATTTPPVVSTPIVNINTNAQIFVSGQSDKSASITVFDSEFNVQKTISLFSSSKYHGMNFQLADLNLDGLQDIVTGTVKGDKPYVRAVDMNEKMFSSFLAFPTEFRGGVNVSAGDVDNDGKVELVVAPQSNYDPVIKIFDQDGKLKKEFYAFNKSYKEGLNVAVGDVDGDNEIEIIVAPRHGILPKVKIFDGQGNLKTSHVVYSPQFLGGVNIGLGDIDNDGILDIITGAGNGGGPHVQAFNSAGVRLASFMAYGTNFRGGVSVAGFDYNRDGKTDIITGAGPSGAPHVRIFDKYANLLGEKFAFTANFISGINVGGN
ncbi:S8 family serine peptidase [Candidatus Kuenenbacteria bacterium]|nr:S8 family serine peptidase [Candidatus Kuenenbacteria bacterium]